MRVGLGLVVGLAGALLWGCGGDDEGGGGGSGGSGTGGSGTGGASSGGSAGSGTGGSAGSGTGGSAGSGTGGSGTGGSGTGGSGTGGSGTGGSGTGGSGTGGSGSGAGQFSYCAATGVTPGPVTVYTVSSKDVKKVADFKCTRAVISSNGKYVAASDAGPGQPATGIHIYDVATSAETAFVAKGGAVLGWLDGEHLLYGTGGTMTTINKVKYDGTGAKALVSSGSLDVRLSRYFLSNDGKSVLAVRPASGGHGRVVSIDHATGTETELAQDSKSLYPMASWARDGSVVWVTRDAAANWTKRQLAILKPGASSPNIVDLPAETQKADNTIALPWTGANGVLVYYSLTVNSKKDSKYLLFDTSGASKGELTWPTTIVSEVDSAGSFQVTRDGSSLLVMKSQFDPLMVVDPDGKPLSTWKDSANAAVAAKIGAIGADNGSVTFGWWSGWTDAFGQP
ncbi:MAG: hypothetical protein L6Q84_05860 [Polyangiaceae bacterium]|nr:hypothetical protein [Polyangiaceae bacterium]